MDDSRKPPRHQPESRPARQVLFVCTGNICRSPTAEGVFRTLVARDGLADRIATASAGTHGYHIGDPPDPRAIAHARRRGYDLSALRARRLHTSDFERYDLLVACDAGHQVFLSRLAPHDRRGRVALLMDYAPELGLKEVPDPYYGGAADFEHVLDIIEPAAAGLLAALKRELG
jgi:protein-tyrosine phosphatase